MKSPGACWRPGLPEWGGGSPLKLKSLSGERTDLGGGLREQSLPYPSPDPSQPPGTWSPRLLPVKHRLEACAPEIRGWGRGREGGGQGSCDPGNTGILPVPERAGSPSYRYQVQMNEQERRSNFFKQFLMGLRSTRKAVKVHLFNCRVALGRRPGLFIGYYKEDICPQNTAKAGTLTWLAP